jgi:hypothetical protein
MNRLTKLKQQSMERSIAAIPAPLIPLPIRMGRGFSIDGKPSPPRRRRRRRRGIKGEEVLP